jgi:hypothetical protein
VRRRSFAATLASLLLPGVALAQGPGMGQPVLPPQPSATPAPSAPAPSAPAPAPGATANGESAKVEGSLSTDTGAAAGARATAPALPAAPAAPAEPKADEHAPASAHEGSFEFGSYGRVWAASDLRGGTGRGTNVVAFGPRIVDEGSYAELELRREDKWNEHVKGRVVATLALFPPFFHFDGNAAQAIGVRNLYAQGSYDNVTMWAGSRMYRGDDIYLLNWWPLDNQNTVGGGVGGPIYKSNEYETILQAHAGMQRLDNPYQFQQIPVVAPYGFGTVNVTKLDRPRTIETLKATQFIRPGGGPAGFKAILYGELHQLAAGTFKDPLIDAERGLPSDSGFLVGSQLTYFAGVRDTYASLVLRHARGIAAYDPLAVPITFALDRTVNGASETQIALSGNWESEWVGVTAAGYVRFFRDGSPTPTTTQKYDEGTIVARPSVFLGEYFGLSVEGSYQQRRLAIVGQDGDGPLNASVTKLGLMPYFSPSGRGTFHRPQIRLLYVASFRNSGTRALYAQEDVFSQRATEHFFGIGAEWWFNSSSYP